jgi:hypothetical protein
MSNQIRIFNSQHATGYHRLYNHNLDAKNTQLVIKCILNHNHDLRKGELPDRNGNGTTTTPK